MNFLSQIKHGMHSFGNAIATLVNTVLLFVVYCIGVGLTALFARLSKKRFLDTSLDTSAQTYWEKADITTEEIDTYYRQF